MYIPPLSKGRLGGVCRQPPVVPLGKGDVEQPPLDFFLIYT